MLLGRPDGVDPRDEMSMNQFDRVGGKKAPVELRNLGQVPIADTDTILVFTVDNWRSHHSRS